MKTDYSKSIRLRCIVCGSDSNFEHNEDKTYIKCTNCNREYLGGYDELVELNEGLINEELEATKQEIANDAKEGIIKSLKNAFKGCKHIKIK